LSFVGQRQGAMGWAQRRDSGGGGGGGDDDGDSDRGDR
jgi:hypothetical protein